MQEVQTGVWITNETTLETIEAIGTSSFKIREWRQTTARYVSGCKASGSVSWYYSSWGGTRDSWEVKSSNTTISEISGKQEFIIRDWGIRVPVAWTYEITFTWNWWGSTENDTLILKWWGNVLYTKEFTSYDEETVTITADLGKFDLIEIYGDLYYTWSSSAATLWLQVTSITIQQI